MSACCSTYGNVAGAHFNEKIAQRDLENYRKKGPGPTARLLRDMLVDASVAYLAAAVQEATRRARLGAVEFRHGDFLDVASTLPPAAIVTMDRVICYYPGFEALLQEALGHAERYFAYSYPRDLWYVRAAIAGENGVRRLRRNPFRAFVHPVARMTQTIEAAGFRLAARRRSWQWSAEVWVR